MHPNQRWNPQPWCVGVCPDRNETLNLLGFWMTLQPLELPGLGHKTLSKRSNNYKGNIFTFQNIDLYKPWFLI